MKNDCIFKLLTSLPSEAEKHKLWIFMCKHKIKADDVTRCDDCLNSGELGVDQEFYFQWHLTERCNLRCTHCYHENYSSAGELDGLQLLKSAEKMVGVLEKWDKVGSFSLTGGEPFTRKNELISLAKELDQFDRVAYYDILTNGSLIDSETAQLLHNLGKLRRVQLSLEGTVAETNDNIRGQGSFESTIKTIRLLKKAGVAVSVMSTIFKSNFKEIIPLINLLEEEGVDTFALERFIPEGQGSRMANGILSPQEIKEVFHAVWEAGRQARGIRVLMYRPLFGILDAKDPTVGAMCSVGTNALTIMHDGTIYPCRRLPIPLGNILVDSLYKIWYDSPVLWNIRNPANLKGKCRNCEYIPICRGCRAVAFAKTGDYLAEDSQCWL